jgi:hypothetical protein
MSASYLHAISGRIRIKIAKARGSEEEARRLEAQLGAHTGVRFIRANPITGNVLIHYDPSEVREREIIRALRRLGWLARSPQARREARSPRASDVAALFAEKALTVGLEVCLLRLLRLA